MWRKDPAEYAAAAALGLTMQRGNLEEAIYLWNQALAINPSLVLVRQNLATALVRAGRIEEVQ